MWENWNNKTNHEWPFRKCDRVFCFHLPTMTNTFVLFYFSILYTREKYIISWISFWSQIWYCAHIVDIFSIFDLEKVYMYYQCDMKSRCCIRLRHCICNNIPVNFRRFRGLLHRYLMVHRTDFVIRIIMKTSYLFVHHNNTLYG